MPFLLLVLQLIIYHLKIILKLIRLAALMLKHMIKLHSHIISQLSYKPAQVRQKLYSWLLYVIEPVLKCFHIQDVAYC
jgi:hypothetical protein